MSGTCRTFLPARGFFSFPLFSFAGGPRAGRRQAISYYSSTLLFFSLDNEGLLS